MAFTPEYTGDAALGFTGDRDFDDMIRDEQARQSAAQFRQYLIQQQAAGNPAYQDYIYGLPGGGPGQLEAGVNIYGMRGPEYEVIPYSTPEEYLAAYNTKMSTPVPKGPSTRRGLFGTPIGLLASLAIPFAAPAVGGLLGLSGAAAGIGGGAALGGGLAAIGGQDPLRGAVLGGLSGGLGSLGTAVPSESLVSAVPATIPETFAGAIRDPLLRGAVQGSLNASALATASQIQDRPDYDPAEPEVEEPPSIEEIIAGIPDLVPDTAPPPAPDIDIPPPAPLPPATQEAAPAPETEESEEDPESVFLPGIRERSRDILDDVLDRVGFTPPISPTGGTPPPYIPTSPRIPGTTVPSTPYIPPGPQTTVPERIRIEGRIPIPGPGFEDLPIDLGSVQDILDVILDGAPPPTPQIPTLPVPGAPSTPVLGEVEDVLGGILDSVPILGDILGSPDEPAAEQPPAAEPLPPIPGEADEEDGPVPEPLPPIPSEPEPPSLDDILDPPGAPEDVDGALGITEPASEEPVDLGTAEPEPDLGSEEPVDLGTAEPAPEDLGSLMGLMGLMGQTPGQTTLETPKPGDIRIYDLENFFGVSGLDNLYNAPFQDELTLITEELLKAARERRA